MKYLVAYAATHDKGQLISRTYIEEDRPITQNILLNWETIRIHAELEPYFGKLTVHVTSFQQVAEPNWPSNES